MGYPTPSGQLLDLLTTLNSEENQRLSPAATRSSAAQRRRHEEKTSYRQQFAIDADRILHSRAYSRYIDKTQVFSLIRNDHISHRIIHVQLVARIARTIGRFLFLNEDLIEAIALGHDIGHPPFGHDGEHYLSDICRRHGLHSFQHNIQSVRFLDQLERKGKGWNLTLQVLDGILCHDGEVHMSSLSPLPISDFEELDRKIITKARNYATNILPATMEGCVMRFADTIAYIGRDIEDAIILGLIRREDLPADCTAILGNTNGKIVYNLVTDLIQTSLKNSKSLRTIQFSEEVSTSLEKLKQFNYQNIYLAPTAKRNGPLIRRCYEDLFSYYLGMLRNNPEALPKEADLMADISPLHDREYSHPERVRDFIAGMTDSYFLHQAKSIGCEVPVHQRLHGNNLYS